MQKLSPKFSWKTGIDIMQIVLLEDNFHDMSKPLFWEKYEKDSKMSSAQIIIDWLCWGLMIRQPLQVILCRLP